MNPEQHPETPSQPATPPPKRKVSLPFILMLWPIAAFVLTIALYALFNFIFTSAASTTTGGDAQSLFGAQNPIQTVINVILFVVGAVTMLFGPLSFIAGLILLIVNMSKKPSQN